MRVFRVLGVSLEQLGDLALCWLLGLCVMYGLIPYVTHLYIVGLTAHIVAAACYCLVYLHWHLYFVDFDCCG